MSLFAIGVDLGGTNLRISAVDSEGTLLEKITTGTQVSKGRDFVIGEMTDAIKTLNSKFSSQYELAGVGIGVPGIIDKRTGMLRESPNLPGWDNYPVLDEIEDRLHSPVILENDANAAAVGENWLGAGRGIQDMGMITLGTGVGGGLILDGSVVHGMSGMAGELGHITVEPEGHPCNCGNVGCVEQYASATAVVRMAKEAIDLGAGGEMERLAHNRDVEFSAKSIFNLALQGDPAAKLVFEKVGRALGIMMADIINAFNLHMYVIGGGVSNAWEAFAPRMFHEVRRRSMVYAATAPPTDRELHGASAKLSHDPPPRMLQTIITRAVLGSDAGLYGAARLPLMRNETA